MRSDNLFAELMTSGQAWSPPVGGQVRVLRAHRPPGRTVFPEVEGVLLDAETGLPVLAVLDGVVVTDAPLVVLHAENVVTRYQGVGARRVRPGDRVTAGSPLGEVQAGPLRFEVGVSLLAPRSDEFSFQPLDANAVLAQVGSTAHLLPENGGQGLWRGTVPLAAIPVFLRQAIVVTEDRRFYQHHGVDVRGIGRALITNLRQRRIVSGASTITQQAARSALRMTRRTLARKMVEIPLALALEWFHSKDAILDLYLNSIYWGRGATTVAAAAVEFFNKNVWQLNFKECAVLAGLPNHPQGWGLTAADAARIEYKAETVLRLMRQHGVIDETIFARAQRQSYTLVVDV